MSGKWNKYDWYEYHKKKAADAAIAKHAPAELSQLKFLDRQISELEAERKSLSSQQRGFFGLLSLVIPDDTQREIVKIDALIKHLREQRHALKLSTKGIFDKAAAIGVSNYHQQREVRAAAEEAAAKERRIKYLERSPAIRSAQASIKEHLLAQYSESDEIKCYYCETVVQPEDVHIEHKTPVARGGTNSRKNVVLACAFCNLRKGKKTEAEFRRYLERKG